MFASPVMPGGRGAATYPFNYDTKTLDLHVQGYHIVLVCEILLGIMDFQVERYLSAYCEAGIMRSPQRAEDHIRDLLLQWEPTDTSLRRALGHDQDEEDPSPPIMSIVSVQIVAQRSAAGAIG